MARLWTLCAKGPVVTYSRLGASFRLVARFEPRPEYGLLLTV